MPADWAAFSRYFAEMLASPGLGVDAGARALGESVLSGVGTWVRPPAWYRALTASWLPERFREGFGLAFGAREQARVARAAHWVPRVYGRVPRVVRYVGPYLEAEARLSGREPGWWVRRNNGFWMGRERMLYPGV